MSGLRSLVRSLRRVRSVSRAVRTGDALTLAALAVDAGIGLKNMLPRPEHNVGFLYVMTTASQPGVKVGYASNVERRRKEMRTTGHPHDFVVEAFFSVVDMRAAERKAHESLSKYRWGDRHAVSGQLGEHFLIGVPEAVEIIAATLDADEDSYFYRRRGWK